VLLVPFLSQNGLSGDSLLICVEPMTFDKIRLVQRLEQPEPELLKQTQATLRQYLSL
jgi:mRNA interferase MazF